MKPGQTPPFISISHQQQHQKQQHQQHLQHHQLQQILFISIRHGNGYMQSQQPWVLLKGTDDEKARAATIIGLCCNIACFFGESAIPLHINNSKDHWQAFCFQLVTKLHLCLPKSNRLVLMNSKRSTLVPRL